jgi:hypothetical protein
MHAEMQKLIDEITGNTGKPVLLFLLKIFPVKRTTVMV